MPWHRPFAGASSFGYRCCKPARQEWLRPAPERKCAAEERPRQKPAPQRAASCAVDRRASDAIIDELAADIDEAPVANARRTRRLATAAGEATIEVELRPGGHFGAFERLLDEVDAPARPVQLVAEQLVRRARRRAEAAVHARAEDRFRLLAVGRVRDGGQQPRLHQSAAYMRPRFRIPCGSNTCFSRSCSTRIGGGNGWNAPADLFVPRYSVAAAVIRCPPAQRF